MPDLQSKASSQPEAKQANGGPTIPGLDDYGDDGEIEMVDMDMDSSGSEDDNAIIESFPPPGKGIYTCIVEIRLLVNYLSLKKGYLLAALALKQGYLIATLALKQGYLLATLALKQGYLSATLSLKQGYLLATVALK